MKHYWVSILLLFFTSTASAADGWLIATKTEHLNASGILSLEVIKPDHVKSWPRTLTLTLMNGDKHEEITLTRKSSNDKPSNHFRRGYTGIVSTQWKGNVRLALVGQKSNRLLLAVASGADAATLANNAEEVEEQGTQSKDGEFKRVYISDPIEDRTISANEPLYFIVGSSDQRDFDARFQISFKYRPFDPDARVTKFVPYASNLYFGYTQTSIWDLGGESSPFKDTSYRPSIFYNWSASGESWKPDTWKFGLEHESNGRDGDNSRSMNIAFVQPLWKIDYSGGKRFTFMPKFYAYLEKSDNTDIGEYRGYVDWLARYGREDAAILTAMYRQGTEGFAQGQLDLSYPISDKLFGRTGTFLHFQLLGGYGETLIDYDKRSDVQLRVGVSLAR